MVFPSAAFTILVLLVFLSQTNVQNAFEDPFKVPIAEWVYERVESGVDVTQPYREHVQVMVHTLSAERHDHESYEVRNPAQHEGSDYEAQLLGRFVLFVDPQTLDALTWLFHKLLPRLSQSQRVGRVQFGVFDPFIRPRQSLTGVVGGVERRRVSLHIRHLTDIADAANWLWHCDVTFV